MNDTITLTIQQIDAITLSLNKASSIAQLLILCGPEQGQKPERPDHDSLFVVTQILADELEKVEKALEAARG